MGKETRNLLRAEASAAKEIICNVAIIAEQADQRCHVGS
jgi:hypothetical protein